uniref:Uncharacterized protein n=1 Tax=Corethron hystrix TaxID=216773 RepID=A0A7S1BA07_9STRA
MAKLSPSTLFYDKVAYAFYIDQTFQVPPNDNIIRILTDELVQEKKSKRIITLDQNREGEKRRFLLPEEPRREALLLLTKMNMRNKENTEVSIYQATKSMIRENGGDIESPEPPSLTKQREFYERVPYYVNSDFLKSVYEPVHRFEIENFWASTRWIVHNLRREESQILRCAWYEEHSRWGNDLDQLSLAFVLAKLQLERKFRRDEIDDHNKEENILEQSELDALTNRHEWNAFPSKDSGWPIYENVQPLKIPTLFNGLEEFMLEKNADNISHQITKTNLYVRLMSNKRLLKTMSTKLGDPKRNL